MNCKSCGKELDSNQAICPHCLTPQEPAKPMVSLSELHQQAKNKKKPFSIKQLAWRAAGIALAAVVFSVSLASGCYFYTKNLLDSVGIAPKLDESNLGINNTLPTDGVTNIALFGLDTRSNDDVGRSDSMIILSIDRRHNKIKLTSLARDSLVPIEGYGTSDGRSKLTHAWFKGKAQLAVKTINQNFQMNITNYAYVNFYEFSEIIDFIGGVNIDVSQSEMNVMNVTYAPYIRDMGISCPNVTKTGMQKLCGGQALAYSRNRYTGSDLERGDRQKEVLMAMFDAVKDVPITDYPSMIKQILGICHTTLNADDLMDLAKWAITQHPTFESFRLPCPELKAWGGVAGYHGWVYIYDLNLASTLLHNFIYETGEDLGTVITTAVKLPESQVTTTQSEITTTGTQADIDVTGTGTDSTKTTTADGTDVTKTTTTTGTDTSKTTGSSTASGSTTTTSPSSSTTTRGSTDATTTTTAAD